MAFYTNIGNNTNKKKQRSSPRDPLKQAGIILLIIASCGTVALFTNFLPFLRYFLMGTFGVFSYAIFSSLFIFSRALISGKKLGFNKRYALYLLIALISFLSILQMAFLGRGSALTFFQYISDVYNHQTSIGGVVIASITYPVMALLKQVGAYVFYIIILAIMSALIIDYLQNEKTFQKITSRVVNIKNSSKQKEDLKEEGFLKRLFTKKQKDSKKSKSSQFYYSSTKESPISKGQNLKVPPINTSDSFVDIRSKSFEDNTSLSQEEQLTPFSSSAPRSVFKEEAPAARPPRILHTDNSQNFYGGKPVNKDSLDLEKKERNLRFLQATLAGQKNSGTKILGTDVKQVGEQYSSQALYQKIKNNSQNFNNPKQFERGLDNIDAKLEEDLKALRDSKLNSTSPGNAPRFLEVDPVLPNTFTPNNQEGFDQKRPTPIIQSGNITFEQTQIEQAKKSTLPQKPRYKKPNRYVRPPMELLTTLSTNLENDEEEYLEKSVQLEQVLNDFKIPAKVIAITKGPAVTRYELQMPVGVSVKRITQHAEDIAMTLASNGAVRIEAPIPGKNAVGVEVPNDKIATIGMRDILDSREFIKSKSPLTFGLGKDIGGEIQISDLAKMPHLLIAGATGSGKSVCLHSIIISMLYKTSPEDLRLILIDPKRVEFYVYNKLPHLMLPEVITDPEKAINALSWAVEEMERRFTVFQEAGAKNLAEYNIIIESSTEPTPKIPIIVIVVDELADLMLTNKREVEEKILRLAGKARAAGIHLVIATQRPSVDVITGTIKANLTSRIALALTSFADSKTILDGSGAEKLLGKGDMLYAPIDYPEPKRVQGAFISTNEVKNIVEFIKDNNHAYFDEEAVNAINQTASTLGAGTQASPSDTGFDPLMPQALRLVIESGQASITMIQRRFGVGYSRAGRIIDQMEISKFISPSDGAKARSVYITMEKYLQLFGEED